MYSPFLQDQAYSTGACITSAIPTALLAFITQNADTNTLVVLNVVLFLIAQGFVFLRWWFDRKSKK